MLKYFLISQYNVQRDNYKEFPEIKHSLNNNSKISQKPRIIIKEININDLLRWLVEWIIIAELFIWGSFNAFSLGAVYITVYLTNKKLYENIPYFQFNVTTVPEITCFTFKQAQIQKTTMGTSQA